MSHLRKISFKADTYGDACCSRVFYGTAYIGCYCEKSGILAAEGEVVGVYSSKDELKNNLVFARKTLVVDAWMDRNRKDMTILQDPAATTKAKPH